MQFGIGGSTARDEMPGFFQPGRPGQVYESCWTLLDSALLYSGYISYFCKPFCSLYRSNNFSPCIT